MIESLAHTAALNDRLLAACAYALGKSGNVHKAHMHAQLLGLAGAACLDQPVSDARTTNNEVKLSKHTACTSSSSSSSSSSTAAMSSMNLFRFLRCLLRPSSYAKQEVGGNMTLCQRVYAQTQQTQKALLQISSL